MLDEYPVLCGLVAQLETYLIKRYPEYFGTAATHPCLPLKPFKVIHDNLWGTNRFSSLELVVVDSPIFQRLRDIHQVGLAYQVYPSARHTRFEHSLGVVTIATRVFDALVQRNAKEVRGILKTVFPDRDDELAIDALRQELRLAALLHDLGHSLFSHTSERIYKDLKVLRQAADELTRIVGKRKGSGEVLSFALSRTPAVMALFDKALAQLKARGIDCPPVDPTNVSFLIVGRSRHPLLQFMADIVSSGLDADKLDYLLRDASGAGLPLRYDLERFLYSAGIVREILTDGDGELERFYRSMGSTPERKTDSEFPYYDSYRLRLPQTAMSTFEQIVICKMMLYGYIYHHPKVRAAEGMMARTLSRLVTRLRESGRADEEILELFLDLTDAALVGDYLLGAQDVIIAEYSRRIRDRLLAREVFRMGTASVANEKDEAKLRDFLSSLQDKERGAASINTFEERIGQQVMAVDAGFAASAEEAVWKAGVWLDVPTAPKFEDTDKIFSGSTKNAHISLGQVFPVDRWIDAYLAHRYFVRIFAFSEHSEIVGNAATEVIRSIVGIDDANFYKYARRVRSV